MIPNLADSRWLDISCPLFELVRGDEISWIQKYGRKVVQIIQSIPRERLNSDKKYGFRFLVLKYDSYNMSHIQSFEDHQINQFEHHEVLIEWRLATVRLLERHALIHGHLVVRRYPERYLLVTRMMSCTNLQV